MTTDSQAPGAAREPLLRQIIRKAAGQSIPLHAMFELTNRCNLRCRHCYVNPAERGDELSLAEIKDLLQQLADAGGLFLSFSGGEPLLRDDFLEIAGYARRLGFTFTLFTNGTLVEPALADALRELCAQRVEISILGGQAETHDAITGVAGSFRAAVRGARRLLDRGITVQFKTTWLRANVEELPLVERLVRDLGAGFRAGHSLLPRWNGHALSDTLHPSAAQLGVHARAYAAADRDQGPRPVPPAQQRDVIPCGVGQASCLIDSRGQLLPCVALRVPVADLRKERLASAWASSPELRRLRSIRLADLPACRGCALYTRCNRCAGLAEKESGSVMGPSLQACRLAYRLHRDGAGRLPPKCPG